MLLKLIIIIIRYH